MYVPIHALNKVDICSILSVAFPSHTNPYWKIRVDSHHSRRTMLYVLLSMKCKLNHSKIPQFITECYPGFSWSLVEKIYSSLTKSHALYQVKYHAQCLGKYWELQIPNTNPGPKQSRKYISRYRSKGFRPVELKIYWNYDQLKTLHICKFHNPVTDNDARFSLLNSPVNVRNNSGIIEFIQSGIQHAVFQVPKGKQVIVLDFADERMPGGYYLENAMTQEEVILFNSDGYRALLDIKYTMMDGGYMLPEYGAAYIKRVRFFRVNTSEERLTDLIVSACYDLSSHDEGLYMLPSNVTNSQIRFRTLKKFQTLIASAVANTEGNGNNTYLLLGPIGTGAFANDKTMIAQLFYEVLNNKLMHSTGPVKYVFERIWFVSIGSLSIFQNVFRNENIIIDER